MLKIRLKRVGRRHQPSFRIVVMDSRAPRDGKALEEVGFYNPRTDPAELRVALDRVEEWTSKGAQPTPTVKRLLARARREAGASPAGAAQAG